MEIDVSLAGLTFPCRLRYPETARYFPAPDPAALRVGGEPVRLSEEDWRYYLSTGMEDCAHTEFSLLTAAFSEALMAHEGMILHAAAIRWQDKAYLIAARSGVGKSTQVRCLQELRPGEFSVICGDRPALQFCHCDIGPGNLSAPAAGACAPDGPSSASTVGAGVPDGPQTGTGSNGRLQTAPTGAGVPDGPSAAQWQVMVHPSHWNGKEDWRGAEAAPLEGLILLCRGEENRLASLSPREAAIFTYSQIIQNCADPEKMKTAAALATRLLNAVPIWQLTTFCVPDSTRLLLEAVFS